MSITTYPCGCVYAGGSPFCLIHEKHLMTGTPEKHRASYLTVAQAYNLNVVCRPIALIGYGTFHVGSSLTRPDYHDVDLRCILPDEDYDRMFESDRGEPFLLFLNTAISEWIASRTGLPIDFQFQRATQANETFKGRRNGVGH